MERRRPEMVLANASDYSGFVRMKASMTISMFLKLALVAWFGVPLVPVLCASLYYYHAQSFVL